MKKFLGGSNKTFKKAKMLLLALLFSLSTFAQSTIKWDIFIILILGGLSKDSRYSLQGIPLPLICLSPIYEEQMQ